MADNEEIDFRIHPSRRTEDDVGGHGWISFDVHHRRDGVHVLQMSYASRYSRPCRIRIDGREINVGVACGTTPDDDSPRLFLDEGFFDLGPAPGPTRIGFRPRRADGERPNIVSFRFVPEDEVLGPLARGGSRGRWRDSSSVSLSRLKWRDSWRPSASSELPDAGPTDARQLQPLRTSFLDSSRWQQSPTAVTFSFEVGAPCKEGWDKDEVEVVDVYLRGRAIKFTYGEAHDSVSIDGDPIGDKRGGDNWPIVTFYARNDYVAAMTLGLSSYSGEGAFNGLILQKQRGYGGIVKEKKPLVGAKLVEPTWTYDRNRLGLNLWVTSIYAPKHRPVSRYGFTLSSDARLDFNQVEFELFWDWFVKVKHQIILKNTCDRGQARIDAIEEERMREKMKPLHDFLLASFSSRPANPMSAEGYLYGTNSHVSLTFDVFSVCIYRLPDGETFQSTLFVDGEQYDCHKSRLEELNLLRNEILAFAISLALRDDDLLQQMGLALPMRWRTSESKSRLLDERELLPLRNDKPLFHGNYGNTVMARRIISILAITGLRKVTYETVTSNERDEWDIYCLASASPETLGRKGRREYYLLSISACVCGLIQLVTPIFIIYRSVTADMEDLTWDVYIVRFLFGVYAILFEYKTWEIDNEERVVGWLCFLPEFSMPKLIVGMGINKLSKVIVSAAIITILLRSYSVVDVTLNALALYFVLEVDNLLVDDSALEKIRKHQRQEYFNVKSKTAIEYRWPRFTEDDLPTIKELPTRYFIFASHHVTEFCMFFLSVGCIYMLVEPWVLGWDASSSKL